MVPSNVVLDPRYFDANRPLSAPEATSLTWVLKEVRRRGCLIADADEQLVKALRTRASTYGTPPYSPESMEKRRLLEETIRILEERPYRLQHDVPQGAQTDTELLQRLVENPNFEIDAFFGVDHPPTIAGMTPVEMAVGTNFAANTETAITVLYQPGVNADLSQHPLVWSTLRRGLHGARVLSLFDRYAFTANNHGDYETALERLLLNWRRPNGVRSLVRVFTSNADEVSPQTRLMRARDSIEAVATELNLCNIKFEVLVLGFVNTPHDRYVVTDRAAYCVPAGLDRLGYCVEGILTIPFNHDYFKFAKGVERRRALAKDCWQYE